MTQTMLCPATTTITTTSKKQDTQGQRSTVNQTDKAESTKQFNLSIRRLATMVTLRSAALLVLLASPLSVVYGFSSLPSPRAIPSMRTRASSLYVQNAVDPSVERPPFSDSDVKPDSVIVGGGPAGLLTAIMLAQKFPDQEVKVFDRLDVPPSPSDESVWNDVAKFYLIGLGSRGQTALKKFGVWDEVEAACTAVVGRKDWSPESGSEDGVETIFKDRPVTTQVLPRDKLVGVLHQHILNNYAGKIQLNYGYDAVPEDFAADSNKAVKLNISKCKSTSRKNPASVGTTRDNESDEDSCNVEETFSITAGLVIAADGTARTVANEMEAMDKVRWGELNAVQKLFAEKPFSVKRYEDDNCRVYKTIPMKLPTDWRPDLNYSARTKDGRVNYDALPADKNGNYCGVLLIKDEDKFANENTDPVELRAFLDDTLPQFSALLDDETVAGVAKKPVSYLPSFRYAGPRLNQGDRTLILGDCAHTVKPYFGLGANSALEDTSILDECLDETGGDIPKAVRLFSDRRAKDSKMLVKISRDLDRPGKLGFLTFLLPIILDGIFSKMLPKVFAPNTIAMLQRQGITFTGIGRRKRMDRAGQVAILGAGMCGFAWGVKSLIKGVAKVTGQNSAVVSGGMASLLILASMLKKVTPMFNPNASPADALNKMKKKDGRSLG